MFSECSFLFAQVQEDLQIGQSLSFWANLFTYVHGGFGGKWFVFFLHQPKVVHKVEANWLGVKLLSYPKCLMRRSANELMLRQACDRRALFPVAKSKH